MQKIYIENRPTWADCAYTGEQVRWLRTSLGMTRRELAEAIGVDPSTIFRCEKHPDMAASVRVAIALGRIVGHTRECVDRQRMGMQWDGDAGAMRWGSTLHRVMLPESWERAVKGIAILENAS